MKVKTVGFQSAQAAEPVTASSARINLGGVSTLLSIAFVVVLVSPLVGWIGRGFTTAWPIFALWLLVSFYNRRGLLTAVMLEAKHRRLELLAFGGWCIVIFLNYLSGRGYTGRQHVLLTLTLAMIVFMELVYSSAHPESARRLRIGALLLLGLEALRSLPTLWTEPLLPRNIMALGAQSADYAHAMLSSVGEYGLYTGLAIALAYLLAFALESHGFQSLVMLGACAAIAIAIALATFMGAILLMALGFSLLFIFALVTRALKPQHTLVFLIIIIAAVYLWSTMLATSEQGELFWDKLLRQTESVTELGLLEGDVTNRADLWMRSVNTFLEQPIFGVGPVTGSDNPYMGLVVGGHSSWLDLLAQYGIVGFLCYTLFIGSMIRRALVTWKRDRKNYENLARIVVCILFVLAGSYNPVVFTTQVEVMVFLIVMMGTGLGLETQPNAASPQAYSVSSRRARAQRAGRFS